MIPILYGFRDRDREVKSGAFDCPNCRKRRFCKHRKIESWLAIFFVPVCPWKIVAEYAKCDDCHRSFEKPALREFLPKGGVLRSDLRGELYAGAPIESALARLTQSGIDAETARVVVDEIAGGVRNACPGCRLSYLENVTTCRECGDALATGAKKTAATTDLE